MHSIESRFVIGLESILFVNMLALLNPDILVGGTVKGLRMHACDQVYSVFMLLNAYLMLHKSFLHQLYGFI